MSEDQSKKEMLFVCFLYMEENGTGQFEHSTKFQILATSEEEAEKIARSYQPDKKHFYVLEIVDPIVLKTR